MKTFISILLFGLLGFLGCSGSNDATSTTNTTIGQAVPVAPYGIVGTSTPTYEWTPVQGATKYRLLVHDTSRTSSIQDSNQTPIVDVWITAEEARCDSFEGLCTVTPAIEVTGTTWKVLACAGEECGLWSETINFEYKVNNAFRFFDNGDGTVTDSATQCTWTRRMNQEEPTTNWSDAIQMCDELDHANKRDWGLPALHEIKGVIEASKKEPDAFTSQTPASYWTTNVHRFGPLTYCRYPDKGFEQELERPRLVWVVREMQYPGPTIPEVHYGRVFINHKCNTISYDPRLHACIIVKASVTPWCVRGCLKDRSRRQTDE
jgi:hypothetical protein